MFATSKSSIKGKQMFNKTSTLLFCVFLILYFSGTWALCPFQPSDKAAVLQPIAFSPCCLLHYLAPGLVKPDK